MILTSKGDRHISYICLGLENNLCRPNTVGKGLYRICRVIVVSESVIIILYQARHLVLCSLFFPDLVSIILTIPTVHVTEDRVVIDHSPILSLSPLFIAISVFV